MIASISAGGEISRSGDSPTNRLAITAMDGIDTILAQTIRANITANSTGSGAIRRIRTTVDGLIGSVTASALTSSTVGDGLLIAGNLEATVNIPGSLSAPIRVGGNVQNGGSLTSGALQNSNDAEIDITGSLGGSLSIGAVSRRVRIQGGVPSGSTLTTGAINNVSTYAGVTPNLHAYETNLWGTLITSDDLAAGPSPRVAITVDPANARAIVIKPAPGVTIAPSTRYIVTRNGNGVRCGLVTGNPAVADFQYNFFVATQGDGSHTGDLECGTADFNGDGDFGTDADIEAFFRCLAGDCCLTCWHLGADFNGDGDVGTDLDIEAFFRVLAGGHCAT